MHRRTLGEYQVTSIVKGQQYHRNLLSHEKKRAKKESQLELETRNHDYSHGQQKVHIIRSLIPTVLIQISPGRLRRKENHQNK
jgi:hypothetical protein